MDNSTTEMLLKAIEERSYGNNSFVDNALEHAKKIEKVGSSSVSMKDAYGNSLLAIGHDNKVETFTNYGFDNDTLNWPLWLALYNDSWVVKRAIDKPAQDEIKCGITVHNLDDDKLIQRLLKKYQFDLIQLLQWGGLFGGSIACLTFDNIIDEEYSKPMDFSKIRLSKAMRMYVVDRWYGVSADYNNIVDKMGDIDYGKPKYYDVTLADGKTIRFHHDYVIRYEGRTAPKLVKNGLLQGWGYSELSHILNEISRDDKLKSSIQSLIDKSLIEVIKMSGMRGVFMGADKDNEQQLRKRLEMVNWGRSFNSLTFLDKDDEYIMNSYSGLSGLSDLLEKNMWLVSAALEMQGVLFGDMKQGFSTDQDALDRYAETIKGRCESYVRPVYEKLLGIWYKQYDIDKKVDFDFNSLFLENDTNKKVEKLNTYVDLLDKLLNSGIITPKKFAEALQSYANNNVVNLSFTEDELKKLDEDAELSSELSKAIGGEE